MSAMGYPGLKTDLEQLKRFGAHADGGWNRPAYSSVDCQTHEWAAGLMRDAGLRVRYDPAGNLIGRLEPVRGGSGAAVAIGSHLDTVFRGGWLDGGLGVLAGIEIARRLKGEADRLRRPLEVIAFRDEEGRFGAYIGSRAMAGQITEQQLPKLKDPAGVHLVDCLASCDLRVDRFLEAARPRSELAAYLELHVEQGPVLERAGVPIGIVTGIFGQIRLSVRFEGRADHAGTTPMTMRADAYAAAAEFSHQFRRAVLDLGEGVAVGTIGLVRVEPNAGNVVPSRVRLGLEIRDINPDRLERLGGEVRRLAESAATDGVTVSLRTIHEAPPTPLDAALCDRFAAAAETSGVAALRLPSGAGHDVQPMSALTRTGLIFVPSVGGRSHCPEEDTDWADIEAGAAVLEATARDLVEGR